MSTYHENTRRRKMWFGTQHHSEWITCPLRGAEMTPESWGTEGTYLSGGGFVRQSQDSHRQYIFEWSGASSREAAEKMQAYRDGVYSRRRTDLIYFIDPLMYERNVLPKRWAQPGIIASETRITPTGLGNVILSSTPSGYIDRGVPLAGASIGSQALPDFSNTSPRKGSIWVPIPEGMSLRIVAWAEADSVGNGVYVRPQKTDGEWQTPTRITNTPFTVSGSRGVLLGTVGQFRLYGIRAILTPVGGNTPVDWGTSPVWLPGSGNSGCKFVGNPTWIANSGVNGGQIGYAASLKEVGDWQ